MNLKQNRWWLAMAKGVADVPEAAYPPGVATTTQKVYLLDVREPCPGMWMGRDEFGNHICLDSPVHDSRCCYSLSYMPTKNWNRWFEAARTLNPDSPWIMGTMPWHDEHWEIFTQDWEDLFPIASGSTLLEALLVALKDVIRPLAINADAVDEWVLKTIPA